MGETSTIGRPRRLAARAPGPGVTDRRSGHRGSGPFDVLYEAALARGLEIAQPSCGDFARIRGLAARAFADPVAWLSGCDGFAHYRPGFNPVDARGLLEVLVSRISGGALVAYCYHRLQRNGAVHLVELAADRPEARDTEQRVGTWMLAAVMARARGRGHTGRVTARVLARQRRGERCLRDPTGFYLSNGFAPVEPSRADRALDAGRHGAGDLWLVGDVCDVGRRAFERALRGTRGPEQSSGRRASDGGTQHAAQGHYE